MYFDMEHLRRFPTFAAADSLALRLDLPRPPLLYEWHLAVSDPLKLEEFLTSYKCGELNEDERFTLMEVILDSADEAAAQDTSFLHSAIWAQVLTLLEENIELHIYSVFYWSSVECDDIEDTWYVAPSVRNLLLRHQARFAKN